MTSMRDIFFGKPRVRKLIADVKAAWPDFDAKSFERAVLPRLPELGLNERNFLLRDTLKSHLPADFAKALAILLRALGPERQPEGPESYDGFHVMSFCAFVAEYGIDRPDLSLPALREMTMRFSSEFSIRPFLERHCELTLETMRTWATDSNPQVRRLVSEGTRPRLPWGLRLQDFVRDPKPVLALLELLKEDSELFVRRSVANNLNDIAKDHGDLVVATLRRWKKSRSPETQWLVKHALRTLLKQGHPEALELLGYPADAQVHVSGLTIAPKRIRVGDAVTFSFEVKSAAKVAQSVMIDYVVHHMKANGETKPKVFKLTKRTLAPGASERIEKTHSFRPIGIRPYYPGRHAIELQLNGRRHGRVEFDLRA